MRKAFVISLFVSSMTIVSLSAQAQCSWVTQTSSVVENCGSVGIGTTSPLYIFHMIYNQNSSTPQMTIQNQNAGTTAASGIQMLNDAGTSLQMGVTSTAFTPSGVYGSNVAAVSSFGPNGLVLVAAGATAPLVFSSGGGVERMRLDGSGRLGIGIPSPAVRLQLLSQANDVGDGIRVSGSDYATSGAYVTLNKNSGTGTPATLQGGDGASWAPLLLNPHGGAVGVGMTPSYALLQVAGNVSAGSGPSASSVGVAQLTTGGASPTSNRLTFGTDGSGWGFAISKNQGGTVTDIVTVHDYGNMEVLGNISATGTIFAKYQDVAEWVPARAQIDAGTVVVLDPTHENQVMSSATAYDTAVAGVVSSSPGVVLGESGSGKEKIATTGRVMIKVDAGQAPISIGDLLVTSDVPGTAMKSQPIDVGGAKIHRPGTVIGKALQPLRSGRGEILVLLSLQ